ncbi:MAG: anti-sigma factor family protein [Candidatus Methylomirabilales bacterium]
MASSIVGRAQSAICREVTDLLLDYMTGELDPETVSAFEDHLRLCSDCVAFLKTYKKTVQATRSLRFEDIPAEMEKRVRRFLRERTQKGHLGR